MESREDMDEPQGFHTVRGYQLLGQPGKLMTSAMEDYMEMIYRESLREENVRINALSELLHVQPPSATHMVQKLTQLELVNYRKYGFITLTGAGREVGRYLYERHNVVQAFLTNLGCGSGSLTETELIEHNITAHTVRQMMLFNRFAEENPRFLGEWARFAAQNGGTGRL